MDDQVLRTALSVLAGVLALVCLITIGAKGRPLGRHAWKLAVVGLVPFAALSLVAVWNEGPLGFWPEHVRSLWGTQIWADLLLAVVAAVALLAPRALAVGMRPLPWTILVLCSGSIGLYCFLARMLYLEARGARAGT